MTESASSLNYRQAQLADLATQVLDLARRHGATAAEAEVSEGVGQAVSVRLGEVETIEYTGDKGVGVTVYLGQSKGHASSSDFSAAALEDTVKAAINIARFTAADPFAGLADPDRLATEFPDLSLCHPWSLSVEDAIELARATEAAGQAVDARVNNSEGASVNTNLSQFVYANSHGFCHGQRPLISSSSEKLRKVRMRTIAPSTIMFCRVGATATVLMMSPATSSSRPSRMARPRFWR